MTGSPASRGSRRTGSTKPTYRTYRLVAIAGAEHRPQFRIPDSIFEPSVPEPGARTVYARFDMTLDFDREGFQVRNLTVPTKVKGRKLVAIKTPHPKSRGRAQLSFGWRIVDD